tara:strand:- start:371 stop:1486 length:1116 start_codon:yes stop_codon:yes gene_type:complete
MSAFRGILTGYLGAKIADTEAADRLKGEVLASAGKDLLTNILPEQRAAEELRRTNYDSLRSRYNPNIAELGDINNFTRDEASMEKYENFLKKNKLKDPEAFKNLQFETDYNTRYDQRGIEFNKKFEPLLKQIGIDQQGGMGFYTIKNQLLEPGQTDQTMEQPGQTPEAPQEFASTQLSDYFVSQPATFQLPETEFAKVAQGYGFQDSIKFLPDGGVDFTFPGEQRTKYNALRTEANEVASAFIDEGKKVNVGLAVEKGAERIDQKVHGVYRSAFNDYTKKSTAQGDIIKPGTAEYKSGTYNDNFNKVAPTDADKQDFFEEKLFSLSSASSQRYFALSAPDNIPITVTSSDGKKTKQTTLRKYLLSLVPTSF